MIAFIGLSVFDLGIVAIFCDLLNEFKYHDDGLSMKQHNEIWSKVIFVLFKLSEDAIVVTKRHVSDFVIIW